MKLRLKILNGQMRGKHAPIQNAMIIGRGPGTLSLADSKISSRHAEIVRHLSGQWILKDLGSMNGIQIQGKKVRDLVLEPGVQFMLGQTLLTVESAEPEKEAPPELHWSEYFAEFIKKTATKVKSRPYHLAPFPQLLRLRWLRGPQIEWEWYVGYGPREFGQGSVDFPIFDESAPAVSFRIKPSAKGTMLECEKGNSILLNKRPVTTEILRDGDLISFGKSLIEVSFVGSK